MDARRIAAAQACLEGAESGAMTFLQIVERLVAEGFEGYAVDFRRAEVTYYQPDDDSVVLSIHQDETPIAPSLDLAAVQAAIREAQRMVTGYTYVGFCKNVRAAGCAGYMVSFSGRRAVYFGRTAETHVELFPVQAP